MPRTRPSLLDAAGVLLVASCLSRGAEGAFAAALAQGHGDVQLRPEGEEGLRFEDPWLSLTSPESLVNGGPTDAVLQGVGGVGLGGLFADRLWPKLGKLPLESIFEEALALSGHRQRHGQEPDSEGPHIVVEQPTPNPTRLQLAMQLFLKWLQALVIILAWILLLTGLAYLYHRKDLKNFGAKEAAAASAAAAGSPPAGGVEESFKQWKHGVLGCLDTPGVCLWGFCFPPIRWADTIDAVSFMGFWVAFSIYALLSAVGFVTGELLLWIVLTLLCTGYRQQLRSKFGMKMDKWTFAQDCLLYCCCPCCLIVQEANQVDEALKVGHPVLVQTAAKEAPAAPEGDTEAASEEKPAWYNR